MFLFFPFAFFLSILKLCSFPDLPDFLCAFRLLDFTAGLFSEILRMKFGPWCSLIGPREESPPPPPPIHFRFGPLPCCIWWCEHSARTEASDFTFRLLLILSWQGSKSSTITRSKRVNISARCEQNLLRPRKWKRKSLTENMSVWCIPQLLRSTVNFIWSNKPLNCVAHQPFPLFIAKSIWHSVKINK